MTLPEHGRGSMGWNAIAVGRNSVLALASRPVWRMYKTVHFQVERLLIFQRS